MGVSDPALLDEPVPKKKPSADRQINFRAPGKLADRLDDVAEAFGVDVSNLVRLILNQNLARYEKQAERIRSGLSAEEDDSAP